MPHQSEIGWKHSFRKFVLCGHFCDHQQKEWGVFWYFNFWGESSLKFFFPPLPQTCWPIFPDVSLTSVRYPPCCGIFWNLHSTFDLTHAASCRPTQLPPSRGGSVCLPPRNVCVPCSSLLSHRRAIAQIFFFSCSVIFSADTLQAGACFYNNLVFGLFVFLIPLFPFQ